MKKMLITLLAVPMLMMGVHQMNRKLIQMKNQLMYPIWK